MEVTLIRKPQNAQETQKLLNSFLYQTADDEMVYMFKTSELKIISVDEVPWSIDGEFGGTTTEANIKVMPAAIRMIF
jgi:diacylglycerol kinase family enzyme